MCTMLSDALLLKRNYCGAFLLNKHCSENEIAIHFMASPNWSSERVVTSSWSLWTVSECNAITTRWLQTSLAIILLYLLPASLFENVNALLIHLRKRALSISHSNPYLTLRSLDRFHLLIAYGPKYLDREARASTADRSSVTVPHFAPYSNHWLDGFVRIGWGNQDRLIMIVCDSASAVWLPGLPLTTDLRPGEHLVVWL